MPRPPLHLVAQAMHIRYQQRRLIGRRTASAEPHQIRPADLKRYAIDQLRQGDSFVGTDVDGALDLTVEELRKSRPDIGAMEKTADLSHACTGLLGPRAGAG